MAGVNNNLFPPIVDTFTPAFVLGSGSVCNVYFALSAYNAPTSIKGVQVVVQNQKTNASVLKKDIHPTSILFTSLQTDPTRIGDDKYYIQISNDDIDGGFVLNTYYKVQIRFSTITTDNPTDTWLSENLMNFSEWSTVTLIRGISNPRLSLKNFDEEDTDFIHFTYVDPYISGSVEFDSADEETLKSYRIKLYDENLNVLSDSGELYSNPYSSPNEISYYFLYEFEQNVDYQIGIQITTKNLFSWEKEKIYPFSIDMVFYRDAPEVNITAQNDDRGGRIEVSIAGNENASTLPSTNVLFKRTSSKSNFAIWENIHRTVLTIDSNTNYSFYDYTVEPGVWYKYAVMTENSIGLHSNVLKQEDATMIYSEDIFLTTGDKQLKVRFDPQISSFSYNISESRTDTIGSQFPFFRRNGSIKYRSFPLSGTITHFMDARQNLLGASKEDIYRKSKDLYDNFNEVNNITPYTDYIYERQFRQKVMDFLYENNVKLFRSMTEGNILVKLMDISFSPNATLSRRIYTFSCTAYEIDSCTLENMKKYGVLKIDDIDKTNFYQQQMRGMLINPSQDVWDTTEVQESEPEIQNNIVETQSNGRVVRRILLRDAPEQTEKAYIPSDPIPSDYTTDSKGFINVIDVLTQKYQKLAEEGYNTSVNMLNGVKLYLTSRPYLIRMGKTGEAEVVRLKDWINGEDDTFEDGKDGYVLGHLIELNGKPIIVNKEGIYQISSDVIVSSLKLYKEDLSGFAVDYSASIIQQQDVSNIPKSYSSFIRIGQISGSFELKESLMDIIKKKYHQQYATATGEGRYEQDIEKVVGIGVHAAAGTVLAVKQVQDATAQNHMINETEYLEFYDTDTEIEDFYFTLDPAPENPSPIPALIDYHCRILRKRY